MDNVGVYEITNIINGKKYIGSSTNIKKRWSDHRLYLRNDSHVNSYLQSSYNKHGKESFSYHLLEKTCKADLFKREQWYLDNVVKWGFDYNIATNVTSGMKNRRHSDESRKKMSNALRKENSPNWGKVQSESRRKLTSIAQRGENNSMAKLSDENALEIRLLYFENRHTQQELADLFSVSRETISGIVRGKTFCHLDVLHVKNRNVKLTEKNVIEIRRLHATGNYTNVEIGKMFGIDGSNVGHIISRRTWKNV